MHFSSNYRLLVAVSFLQGFVFYGPAATIYRRAYGLDLGGLFLIESISWTATILLEVPWGRFADRFGYKRTLVLGNAVFLLSKIVFAVASGFGGFLAERLLLAVALAALSGCTEALLYRSVPRSEADRAFGRWHAAGSAGLFAAAALFPLFSRLELRATAYATVIPYAAAAVLSCFLGDAGETSAADAAAGRTPRPGSVRAAARALFADRRLLAFLVAGAAIGEAAQAATVFLAPLQYERAGIPRAHFGALFALLQGAGMAAAAAGRFAERLGRRGAMALILVVETASLLALAISDSPAASVAALVAAAAAAALFRPISAAVQNERISGADRATSLSMNALVAEGTAAVLNVAVGGTAGRGLGTAFAALALLGAAAAPLAFFALGTARDTAARRGK